MKINKILFKIVALLIPCAVISFILKNETNFNLPLNTLDNNLEESKIVIKVLMGEDIKKMFLEDYLVGVVAAEMPASFNEEALRAQAVASRTYALYRKNTSKKKYDVTDDTRTQSYIDENKMRKNWGNKFDYYYNKIKNAVLDTKDIVITYDGEIIEALYSAMSSGMTQDVQDVFGQKLDYLKSVESKYDNESIKNYKVTKTLKIDEFKNKLEISCNDIKSFKILKKKSGYVSTLNICDKSFTGNKIKNIFGLRSSNFDLEIGSDVKILTYGYGHGVGMSQYGANGYANEGYSYEDILKHYYTGVELTKLNNV